MGWRRSSWRMLPAAWLFMIRYGRTCPYTAGYGHPINMCCESIKVLSTLPGNERKSVWVFIIQQKIIVDILWTSCESRSWGPSVGFQWHHVWETEAVLVLQGGHMIENLHTIALLINENLHIIALCINENLHTIALLINGNLHTIALLINDTCFTQCTTVVSRSHASCILLFLSYRCPCLMFSHSGQLCFISSF